MSNEIQQFPSLEEARNAGYRSKAAWRQVGMKVADGVQPSAYTKVRTPGYHWTWRDVDLYHLSETLPIKQRDKALPPPLLDRMLDEVPA